MFLNKILLLHVIVRNLPVLMVDVFREFGRVMVAMIAAIILTKNQISVHCIHVVHQSLDAEMGVVL